MNHILRSATSGAMANPMSFELRFTGLCMFVPRYSFASQPDNNHATVLLVDAPGHEPVLVCRSEMVDPAGRQPDLPLFSPDGANGASYALFYLRDQEVVFQPDAENLSFVTGRSGAGQGCPTAANYDDVAWIAPMSLISPGSQQIKTACVTGTDAATAARVVLSQGELSSDLIAKDGSGAVVNWSFASAPGVNASAARQALAERTLLETQIDGQARIDTTLLRTSGNAALNALFGAPGSTLTIILNPEPGTSTVAATVRNTPLSDSLGTTLQPLPTPRDPEAHFISFYSLCTGSYDRIPYPSGATCNGSGVPSPNTLHCPPAIAGP